MPPRVEIVMIGEIALIAFTKGILIGVGGAIWDRFCLWRQKRRERLQMPR